MTRHTVGVLVLAAFGVLTATPPGAPIGRIVTAMLPDGSTLSAGTLPNTPPPGQ